jgi:hypothetical protein
MRERCASMGWRWPRYPFLCCEDDPCWRLVDVVVDIADVAKLRGKCDCGRMIRAEDEMFALAH